jgi:hypothetical protein
MLRVLGYNEIRWVVNWSDHVWVEVYLGVNSYNADSQLVLDDNDEGQWVHLDPCEAAVDNPLLYEEWGKHQTYIVAYHDPFYFGNWRGIRCDSDELIEDEREIPGRQRQFLPVEDVTRQYTSDESHVIVERRGIDNELVAEAVNDVSKSLVDMLQKVKSQG